MQVPTLLMWLVRRFTLVEQDSVSVERLSEFSELPSEDDDDEHIVAEPASSSPGLDGLNIQQASEISSKAAVESLPSLRLGDNQGLQLVLSNLWLRYSASRPWVLRGLSLRVPSGAKVAVLGTTGCGKSTTFQALLRFYSTERGAMVVTDSKGHYVDLRSLSCVAAREHITALLQDGFIFSGTVRENLLGPLADSSINTGPTDEALWSTLKRVGAAEVIQGLACGLDGVLGEQGGGLSAGERALICLSRAIFRLEGNNTLSSRTPTSSTHADRAASQKSSHASTLVLADEPTSSVDLRADAVVHDALLALPQTVLCICHRLHHVPRFDLVAVFSGGECAELGPPAELAAMPGSLYAKLISSASNEASTE